LFRFEHSKQYNKLPSFRFRKC